MTLIRSISGIRGTIGGTPGTGLTPLDTVRYTAAFGTFIRKQSGKERPRMVLGRDARISGPMMRDLVSGTLVGLGFEVVDLDLACLLYTSDAADERSSVDLGGRRNIKKHNVLRRALQDRDISRHERQEHNKHTCSQHTHK